MSNIDWKWPGAVIFLLTVFGYGWLQLSGKIDTANQRITDVDGSINQRITDVDGSINQRITDVDGSINLRIDDFRNFVSTDIHNRFDLFIKSQAGPTIDATGQEPQSTELPERDPDSPNAFGKWKPLEPDLVYRAESDGFIAAFTGGKNPARRLMVYTGQDQGSLDLRTRSGRYDGTVCPVTKDHLWTVKTDGPGSVTVYWLPIVPPSD